MKRLLLLLLAVSLHAAGPVQVAFDSQVILWNNRCITNNPYSRTTGVALNSTISLLASSVWMGGVRSAGLYPGNILRANLMCGGSYGGTNGCGDCSTVGCYNIGSPQIPLINDSGGGMDTALTSTQYYWKYQETGSSGGLSCVSAANYVALNTGLIPSSISSFTDDAHLAIYTMGNSGLAADYTMGMQSFVGVGNGQMAMLVACCGTSLHVASLWTETAHIVTAPSGNNGSGFFLSTRTSSATNGVTNYRNGVSSGSSTTVAGSPYSPCNLDYPVYIFCLNDRNTPVSYTTNRSGGYAIGRGVTASVSTNNYYQAWQQFETLLGRQK